jgi:voltage-gated potassium channel
MASTLGQERQRRPSRWVVARALLRAALTASLLVGIYYLVPVGGRLDGWAVIVLVLGLALFSVVIAWQIRAIVGADYPRLRAIESLATAIPLFLLVFAMAYVLLDAASPDAFSEPLTRTDALYFAVTVLATVGFGDIAPRTGPARVVTMLQMLADLVVIGLVVQVMLGAVKEGIARRAAAKDTADG